MKYYRYIVFLQMVLIWLYCSIAIAGQGDKKSDHNYIICFQEGIDKKKIDVLIKSLSDIQYNPYDISVRSQCYYKINNYKLALRDINMVIENNPVLPMIYPHRGKIYLEIHEYKKAITDFLYALKDRQTSLDYEVYILLSRAYEGDGQLEDAENILLKSLEKLASESPNSIVSSDVVTINFSEVPIYTKLAKLYVKHKKIDEAVLLLKGGVNRNSGSVKLFDFYISLLKETGKLNLKSRYMRKKCKNPSISDSKYCKMTHGLGNTPRSKVSGAE